MKFWVLVFMPVFWTACLPNCFHNSFHNLWRQLYLYAYVNIVKVYLTAICFRDVHTEAVAGRYGFMFIRSEVKSVVT